MRDSMLTTPNTGPNTGIKLHYRVWEGEGKPFVLVHGLASTLRIWDFVAPLLTERFTVIAYDQRGHAGSDKPHTGYDLPTMVEDLAGLVDALELDKPVIVGHSWGATIAMAYAGKYAANTSGVALVDGGVGDMKSGPGATWEEISHRLAPPDLSKYTLDDLVSWAEREEFANLPEGFTREFFGSMMDVQPDGTIRPRLTREHHMEILRAIYDSEPHSLVERVRVPVLAVLARQEAHDPEQESYLRGKEEGARFIESLPGRKKIVWFDNTIHDIPLQRPERLASELLDFFTPQE